MTVTAGDAAASALAPSRTPRSVFQMTRRLVGVSRWPLVLLTTVYAINVSDQFLLPAMFPLLKREFGLSDTALGLLSGSYLITVTLGTVPFGVLADRYTRTRIIAWGTAAWGLTMVFTGSAGGFVMLLIGRMLLGMADPCDNPTSQSLLADYYPVNQRSKVMGVYQIGQLIGFILLPIAGLMGQAWGWRAPFYFFALPAFVVAVLAWRLPEPQRGIQDRRHQRLETADEVASIYDDTSSLRAYRDIFASRTYVAGLVSSSIGSIFFGGIGVWTVTFLIRYHDLSVAEGSAAISLFALGGIVGVLVAGQLADYLNHAGHASARIAVSGFARLVTAPLLFVAFTIDNTPLMLILFTAGAMFLVASIPPLNAVRADVLHPNLRGRGSSLDAVAQSLCSAFSPVLFGILADATDLRTAFLTLIPLTAVAGLILLTVGLASYGRDVRRVEVAVRAEAEAAGAVEPVAAAVVGGQGALAGTPSPPVGVDAAPGNGQIASGEVDLAARDAAVADPAAVTDDTTSGDEITADAPMLQVEELDFSYGSIQVLFGVDLAVPVGGCHALVGRNGVGKSTLLANVAGLLDGQAGRMFYRGTEISGVPPEQRAKLGITLMSAGRSTFPSLSVGDNIWFGSYPFAGDRDLVDARFDAVLEVFPELANRLGQRAGTLSGGEQQMVALARALMAGPDLLLIDELSLGLAPRVTAQLLEVIEQIIELGTTILLVEQSIGVALSVADTVYFMDRGRVESLGPADAFDGDELARRLLEGEA